MGDLSEFMALCTIARGECYAYHRTMKDAPNIARIAALIGDPARANMLVALMQGGALTVSELSAEAGVGLATTSSHVAQLQAGGLITARKSGRHKYLELASGDVAALVEQLMALSGVLSGATPLRHKPGPKDAAMRHARVCYDHLAGATGVQLYQSLTQRGYLAHGADGLALSPTGVAFAQDFGVAPHDLRPGRPALCRDCLDWSMRKSHLAGRFGRALLVQMEIKGWLKRQPASRTIVFSTKGQAAFDQAFPSNFAGVPLDAAPDSP
jgi:DNA-binding transcriptional ArsR family regulator